MRHDRKTRPRRRINQGEGAALKPAGHSSAPLRDAVAPGPIQKRKIFSPPVLYGGSRRGAKPPPRTTAQSRKPQQSTHQRRQTPTRPPAPRRAFQTRHRNAPYAINAAPITTGISISANHNANAATANPAAITATAIATRNTFVAHGVGGGPRNCPSGVMSKTLPAPDSFPRLMMIFMPSKWPPPTPRSRAPSLSFGHPKKPRPRPLTSLLSRSGGSRRGAQPHKLSQPSAGLRPIGAKIELDSARLVAILGVDATDIGLRSRPFRGASVPDLLP